MAQTEKDTKRMARKYLLVKKEAERFGMKSLDEDAIRLKNGDASDTIVYHATDVKAAIAFAVNEAQRLTIKMVTETINL